MVATSNPPITTPPEPLAWVSVRLSTSMRDELDALAEHLRTSRSDALRYALRVGLLHLEADLRVNVDAKGGAR